MWASAYQAMGRCPLLLKGFSMNDLRCTIKAAGRIQEALLKLRGFRYLEILKNLSDFGKHFQEAVFESKRLGLSLSHGWLSAADDCCVGISRLISDMMYRLTQTKHLVERPPENPPSLYFLFEELKQLQQEFGNIDFNLKENAISIVTEPITLDDIYLGPFKIQLELKKLAELYRGSPYNCIALDPHPAATNQDVTHPHVSNEKLCEGEGSAAISAALEQGRLCDFFTLVNSILTNYSPDSPYVSLDDWEGEPCYECGSVMDGDNSYYCSSCDHSFCEECSTCCRGCDETVCLGCSERCQICEDSMCPNCVRRCPECGDHCCPHCFEDGVCLNCKKELENEYEERQNTSTGANENTSPASSETGDSEIKLAG
jgi:hypothetical protein